MEKSKMSDKSENVIPAISVRDLKKSFGHGNNAVYAVRGASFDVYPGTLFSLLGINGAGKTTTIRILTGLTPPDSGNAEIFGMSVADRSTASQRSKIIGLSPQETSTAGNLTVRENLIMTAKIYGFTDAADRADHVIDKLCLGDYAGRLSKTLSGGLRRRLSIGMGIVTDPRVLFLDEPTLGLDVIARRELWDFIGELKKTVTVVLTTHYLEEAEMLSDRIAVMSGGIVTAEGTLSELKASAGLPETDSLENAFIKLASPAFAKHKNGK